MRQCCTEVLMLEAIHLTSVLLFIIRDSRGDVVYLKELCAVNIATIESIINKSVSKSCEIDILPTWLLEEYITDLVPAITPLSMCLSNVKSFSSFKVYSTH